MLVDGQHGGMHSHNPGHGSHPALPQHPGHVNPPPPPTNHMGPRRGVAWSLTLTTTTISSDSHRDASCPRSQSRSATRIDRRCGSTAERTERVRFDPLRSAISEGVMMVDVVTETGVPTIGPTSLWPAPMDTRAWVNGFSAARPAGCCTPPNCAVCSQPDISRSRRKRLCGLAGLLQRVCWRNTHRDFVALPHAQRLKGTATFDSPAHANGGELDR